MQRAAIICTWAILAAPVVFAQPAAQTAPSQPASGPSQVAPELGRLLRRVPDDAHLVIVVPALSGLTQGLNGFGRAIGVDELAGLNVQELLQKPLGPRATAVRSRGAMVIAISAGRGEPLVIAEPGDMAGGREGDRPEDLPGAARVLEFDDEGLAAITAEKVAILARDRADIRRALTATGRFLERCGEWERKCLSQRQVVVMVDVGAWRELINQQINVMAQTAYMGAAISGGPEAEPAIQVTKWLFEQMERLVAEAETLSLGVTIDEGGVFVESRTRFQRDGAVGRYLGSIRRCEGDLLRGLTVDDAAFVVAYEWDLPAGAVSVQEGLAQAMLRVDTLKERIGGEKFAAVMKQTIEMHRTISGSSGTFGPAPGGKGMLLSGMYFAADGPALLRDMRSVFEACPDMMNAWGNLPSTQVRRETVRLGDVEGEAYHFHFDANDAQLQPMIQAIYGEDPVLYLAPHPVGAMYVLGPQEAARALAQEMLSQAPAAMSRDPRVKALMQSMSPHPQGCFLLDLPRSAKMMLDIVQSVGVPFPPIDVGSGRRPLVGLTFYLDPDAVRFEARIPSEPIQTLIRAFEKLSAPQKDGA